MSESIATARNTVKLFRGHYTSTHARARPAGFQDSIAYPVLWPLRYAVVWALLLLILALIAISLDLLFAKQVWPGGTAIDHMESLLRQSTSISPDPRWTTAFAEGAYWIFFGLTGIHEQVLAARDAALLAKCSRRDALVGHPWAAWRDDAGAAGIRMPGSPSRWTGGRDLA